jgi:hypothetical protein
VTMQVGVVAAPHEALVAVTSEPDGLSVVTMIEELPLSVATLAERVADLALELPEAQFVVDGQGIGDALWRVLQPESRLVRDHLVSPRPGSPMERPRRGSTRTAAPSDKGS